MKRILVAVDFSPASDNAAEYAGFLAKFAAAELYLLHVCKDIIPEPRPVRIGGLQNQPDGLMTKEVKYLEAKCFIKVNGSVKTGSKAQVINKYSKHIAADLIVMGVKGRMKNKNAGSTSLKVIRKANIPVLIVPEDIAFSPLKRIVLATNFYEISGDACLNPLFSIIRLFDASLSVLVVDKGAVNMNPAEMPGELMFGHDFSKASYLYDRIVHNGAGQGILQFVQDHPVDLLVMIVLQHSFIEQLFGRVHTGSINSEIKIPLLILKNEAD